MALFRKKKLDKALKKDQSRLVENSFDTKIVLSEEEQNMTFKKTFRLKKDKSKKTEEENLGL